MTIEKDMKKTDKAAVDVHNDNLVVIPQKLADGGVKANRNDVIVIYPEGMSADGIGTLIDEAVAGQTQLHRNTMERETVDYARRSRQDNGR